MSRSTPHSPPAISTRATPRQGTSAVTVPAAAPLEEGHPLLSFEPYRHKAPRRNSITPARQRAFVAHLAATGIVSSAAKHIGKSMEALYKLRHKPGAEGFAAAWDAAAEMGVDRLEENALARATHGTAKSKVLSNGEVVQYGTEYNEHLAMFFLRNRRPDRYGADPRPGSAVYERIRAEVLDQMSAKIREDAKVEQRLAAERERAVAEERERVAAEAAEKAAHAAKLAEIAKAKRTDEDDEKEGLLEWLAEGDLYELEELLGFRPKSGDAE